ncbi:MAG TPA: glycosyltransferase family 4 protein [Polyangiaceae bacterium]|jgi:glycosyltransferase involved in cell wall biosynthesis
MRDVALVSGDFVRTGGMDMPNFALAEFLAQQGANVDLVAYRIADELKSYQNVRWQRVRRPLRSYLLGSPLLDQAGRKTAARVLGLGGRVVVNGGNCQVGDVNWVHYVHAAYEPTQTNSALRRAKAQIARHLALKRERSALRLAQRVIVNSNRTKCDVVERLGVDATRIHTVYYGIDPQAFRPSTQAERQLVREHLRWSDRPAVAFVGALGDRRKGFDTVFAAWTALCRQPSWDADLVVIGTGSERNAWQAKADSELPGRIRFLGFRDDVPKLLSACDALVAPTRYEAFGLGVQEAICCGLPALVSANAGVAEHYPIELRELLLADSESANELERRLLTWRSECERFQGLTLAMSEKLRARTWRTMASEITALLE